MPPNLVNFGLETAENGWRLFAHPSKFPHWETGRGMCYVVARAFGLEP